MAREKQCRACGASGARYPRALVELNRENSGTPLSYVLAIDAISHVVHAVARLASVVLRPPQGRGCQMQLPRAGGKFSPRPPSYSDPVLSLQFVLPSFANELR